MESLSPTLRNLSPCQCDLCDPLGFIIPFTTTTKVLIQDLHRQDLSWDDLIEPQYLQNQWQVWQEELSNLLHLYFPQPYAPAHPDSASVIRQLHVFCDASERAYGTVAYLCTADDCDEIHIAFVLVWSKVAPKKHLSTPRLELNAAFTGAQMANVIQTELTLSIVQVYLWTDSTTVLYWLTSDSCCYKVFVGAWVLEIQNLTGMASWMYVSSARIQQMT
ncbi:hypothetical protein LDENG_00173580 [Lucifuga dentata]|nr:hypothetical protein LDENG_00173580 [Lucifuga dentata]